MVGYLQCRQGNRGVGCSWGPWLVGLLWEGWVFVLKLESLLAVLSVMLTLQWWKCSYYFSYVFRRSCSSCHVLSDVMSSGCQLNWEVPGDPIWLNGGNGVVGWCLIVEKRKTSKNKIIDHPKNDKYTQINVHSCCFATNLQEIIKNIQEKPYKTPNSLSHQNF